MSELISIFFCLVEMGSNGGIISFFLSLLSQIQCGLLPFPSNAGRQGQGSLVGGVACGFTSATKRGSEVEVDVRCLALTPLKNAT